MALRAESHEQAVMIERLVEKTFGLRFLYEPAKIIDLLSIPMA
ncbi:MAG: hypothetical protein OQL19_06660 [Gammaproteobacteria bacterium]|nr:hypothetical protein [Gammaproteobacteria bacterium]